MITLTHQLYGYDDSPTALPCGTPDALNEALASIVTIVAEHANPVHTRPYVLPQHLISCLLIQSSEDLRVTLVNPKVLWVKLQYLLS